MGKQIDTYREDIRYIRSEILVKRPDNRYIKFSRVLNGVTETSLTAQGYIDYWSKRHRKYPNREKEIKELCSEKLEYGLIDIDRFKELLDKSTDTEKEKEKVLKLLEVKIEVE